MYTQNLITRFFGMNGIGPDPFGAPLVVVGEEAEANPFRFSTKYSDGESGLVYYGYRYYAPHIGRWLSKDFLEEDGGVLLYGYAGNDAVGHLDPLGESVLGAIDNYIICLGRCVDRNDPLSDRNISKIVSTFAGGTYPKSWLIALVNKLEKLKRLSPETANAVRLGVKMAKSKVTTIPSSVSLALRQGGKNLLRSLGRATSPFWVAYGLLMAEVEVECASACCADTSAGDSYDSTATELYNKLLSLAVSAID